MCVYIRGYMCTYKYAIARVCGGCMQSVCMYVCARFGFVIPYWVELLHLFTGGPVMNKGEYHSETSSQEGAARFSFYSGVRAFFTLNRILLSVIESTYAVGTAVGGISLLTRFLSLFVDAYTTTH